jgi:ribA/ribD-fused uncharacterized protein
MSSPADLAELRARVREGERFTYLLFWGHRAKATLGPSCLSQWWPCRFSVDGQRYTSAEQWMMAEKARLFGDGATLAEILAADDPAAVKKLGRKVRGYDDARWAAARFDAVVRGSEAKFGQDDALRGFLVKTAPRVLVEASPMDRVWGIGMAAKDPRAEDPTAWEGENLLGFALMRARDALT